MFDLILLCFRVVLACVAKLRKYTYWNKKFLTCFTVFPLVLVGASTRITVVLVVRYACSTVLTRPTATRRLQRHIIAKSLSSSRSYNNSNYQEIVAKKYIVFCERLANKENLECLSFVCACLIFFFFFGTC